jgi:hypothetical protein
MVDMVNKPPHYLVGGIESIDVIKAKLTPEQYEGYLMGTRMAYDLRYPFKGSYVQDLKKSNWYADKLIELQLEKESEAVNPPEIAAQLQRLEMVDD